MELAQVLRCQYSYFITSKAGKASKLSTSQKSVRSLRVQRGGGGCAALLLLLPPPLLLPLLLLARSSSGVSICTFVLVKQVNGVPAAAEGANSLRARGLEH
jgi:hypothetical protein